MSKAGPIIGWKVYYVDSVYSSKNTRWDDLPDDGIQVVVLYHKNKAAHGERYRKVWSGEDYYWITPDSKLSVFCGSEEHPGHRYPGSSVKRGKWLEHEKFESIRQKAMSDKEF